MEWAALVVSVVYCQPVLRDQALGLRALWPQIVNPGWHPEMLERVGIARPVQDYDAYSFDPSGMRQRVMIVMALVCSLASAWA